MSDEIVMKILNNDVALDGGCWSCRDQYGHKKEKPEMVDDEGVCSVCKGVGYQLTSAGEAILSLVKRHLLAHLR